MMRWTVLLSLFLLMIVSAEAQLFRPPNEWILPRSREASRSILGGTFGRHGSQEDEGLVRNDGEKNTAAEREKCRTWAFDPYAATVGRMLDMSREQYVRFYTEQLLAKRDKVDVARFTQIFKTPPTPGTLEVIRQASLEVPSVMCSKLPIEDFAYGLTVVEGCFDRNTQAAFTRFNMPTINSRCGMRLVGTRMHRDSNGDLPGGARPKGIMVESLFDKTFWVVFRATDDTSNWYAVDFDLKQVPFLVNGKEHGKVHRGFFEAFMGLERDFSIMRHVREFAAKGYNIRFTGLSMGAAISTVAALYAKLSVPTANVGCITFGSPRVGDETFASIWDQNINGPAIRVVAKSSCTRNGVAHKVVDVITTVPPRRAQSGYDERASMLAVEAELHDGEWPTWQGVKDSAGRMRDSASAALEGAKQATITGATDAAKSAAMRTVGFFIPYKHVKGVMFMESPAFGRECPNSASLIKYAAANHGFYRGLTEVRLGMWLGAQALKSATRPDQSPKF